MALMVKPLSYSLIQPLGLKYYQQQLRVGIQLLSKVRKPQMMTTTLSMT